MTKNRIIFIGGGNIAEAIFSQTKNNNIVIISHNVEKNQYLQQHYPNIQVLPQLDFKTNETDLVILAIKPQNAKNSCLALQKNIHASYIVSVMAGITTESLKTWLNTDKIVRAMPNTPVLLGYGVTGIYFSNKILPATKSKIENIFKAIGRVYLFNEEDSINKITAVASSAP